MKTSICDLTLYNEHKPPLESQLLHGEPCVLTSLSELVLLTYSAVGAVPGGLDAVAVPHKHPRKRLRLSEASLHEAFANPVHSAAGQPLHFMPWRAWHSGSTFPPWMLLYQRIHNICSLPLLINCIIKQQSSF